MKRLDQICKNVLQNALRFTGRLRVVEAPDADNEYTGYRPRVIIAYALDDIDNRGGGGENSSSSSSSSNAGGSSTSSSSSADSAKWGKTRRLAACFDPLDGSGNADADICTGTVVRVLTVLPFWIGLFSLSFAFLLDGMLCVLYYYVCFHPLTIVLLMDISAFHTLTRQTLPCICNPRHASAY